ncbi:hypothetical protein B0G84_5024 [Paraburkholderia sp. BL8N3]|nr:hypothetical protein B0G84_5024 [Paraburkholderia sp. BL8N3]
MKERPILFSGPMVRALLDGSKTQTRRVLKNQPPEDVSPITVAHYEPTVINWRGEEEPGSVIFGAYSADGEWGSKCPYGEPGDRLWVRETFAHMYRGNAAPEMRRDDDVVYCADGFTPDEYVYGSWKPSIHMPRWASRITLEVTRVRVERLQDISDADAEAEGIDFLRRVPDADETLAPRQLFMCLWDSINESRGLGWNANPWVWVVEFKKL